jgi:hypothetical protein
LPILVRCTGDLFRKRIDVHVTRVTTLGLSATSGLAGKHLDDCVTLSRLQLTFQASDQGLLLGRRQRVEHFYLLLRRAR